jgi:hypothetical protein
MLSGHFQVTFVRHQEAVRGEHPSFTKMAFVAHLYKKRHAYPPSPGETWECTISKDTNPGDPKRGILVLWPVRKIKEEMHWTVGIVIKTEENPVDALRVDCQTVFGNKVLSKDSVVIASSEEIRQDWPDWVKASVLGKFSELDRRRRWEESERVRKEALVTVKKLKTQRDMLIDKLQGRVEVSVLKIEAASHHLTAVASEEHKNHHEVFIDGQSVGFIGQYRNPKLDLSHFPMTVETRLISLSNGVRFKIASRLVEVKQRSQQYAGRHQSMEPATILANYTTVELFSKIQLPWQQALKLVEGQIIGHEFPFQWADQWLTNGTIWLPRVRPERSQWHALPIKALPEGSWEIFLQGLEGKMAHELLPWHKEVGSSRAKSDAPVKPRLTQRQKELEAVVSGQMWQGKDGCERVTVGKNLIFHVRAASGKIIFLMDNPGIGAIYIFADEESARQVATGLMTRSDALKKGHRRVIHISGWEEKVTEIVRNS